MVISAAIVVGAGRGRRFGRSPKQYRKLTENCLFYHALEQFVRHEQIETVIAVINQEDKQTFNQEMGWLGLVVPTIIGGDWRQRSVYNGLLALKNLDPKYVLIHDAARPLVDDLIISRLLANLANGCQAVIPAVAITDTIKLADNACRVVKTVDRSGLHLIQTPQGFDYRELLRAHESVGSYEETFNDDAAICERANVPVTIIAGDVRNIKVTHKDDLELARIYFHHQNQDKLAMSEDNRQLRVGNGFDVHGFCPGDSLWLGGVKIPHNRSLKGHSDADVVLHAITDAILGTLCAGDIGSHFPPSDPKWQNVESAQFLRFSLELGARRAAVLRHIDVTVICEYPKIAPYRDQMRWEIAQICTISQDQVSVKATTSEGLGALGRGEGIAALATATMLI